MRAGDTEAKTRELAGPEESTREQQLP